MTMIKLPYHKRFMEMELPEERIAGVLESKAHLFAPAKSQEDLVREALDHPIGSLPLEELIADKKEMVIITSDHTRPVPSKITLPLILERIRKGNPTIGIKIVIATGSHREMTKEEMIDKFGQSIVETEKLIVHRSGDRAQMVRLGTLATGLSVEVSRIIRETECLMAEGFIEPHFFAGFSGGRKSVFPGMASLPCIMANHCAQYIASPYARTGILEENPVHEEALAVAEMANLQFIVNVVLDAEKRIVKAFAGHFDKAHREGCRFVGELAETAPVFSDIVITTNGGYPLDQNIYQSVKGMTAAEATCNPGGVIIMVSSCCDGHGGEGLYQIFKRADSAASVTEQIMRRGRLETIEDQWEAQILARVMEKHRIIMVTDMCDHQMIKDMHMDCVASVGEALALAESYVGKEKRVTVIPDGIGVIVKKK